MKISKCRLTPECRTGLRVWFSKMTNDTGAPVDVSTLINEETSPFDIYYLANIAYLYLEKDVFSKFLLDCARVNLEVIKPFTGEEEYDEILLFLINPDKENSVRIMEILHRIEYAICKHALQFGIFSQRRLAIQAILGSITNYTLRGRPILEPRDPMRAVSNAASVSTEALTKIIALLKKLFEEKKSLTPLELHINKHKTIRDMEISLGRFNIFVGDNGVGKSNLIEAIASQLPNFSAVPNKLHIDDRSFEDLVFTYTKLFSTSTTPEFFAIENIDSHIYPTRCTALIKLLNELSETYDKRVILTVYNPASLDGINLNDDQQRLFFFRKNRERFTTVKRITAEGRPKSSDDGEYLNLSEAMMRGYL